MLKQWRKSSLQFRLVQKVAVSPSSPVSATGFYGWPKNNCRSENRWVETGRTRVRRFVTEREASADVTLHEEHGEVLRRALLGVQL
jgi:hypothetical protein